MKRNLKWVLVPLVLVALAVPSLADEDVEIANRAAPATWVPAGTQNNARSALTAPAVPLPFVAIAPCRVADTRPFGGFTGAYGPPMLPSAFVRDFQIAGQCGIPAAAKAVSFNFTVDGLGLGFLTAWATGTPIPSTATLVFGPGQIVSNAAVVALGAGGAVSVAAGVSGTDLVIDVNGYYSPDGVVNSVNALSGALTLTAGTNVTITPSGNTLTIAATAGSGGPPSGCAGCGGGDLTGTYPNPLVKSSSANTPSSIVARDGSGGFSAGTITLQSGACPASLMTPLMKVGTQSFGILPLAFAGCSGNTFFGPYSGRWTSPFGIYNSGFGELALEANTDGSVNSAFGGNALSKNTTGSYNTAVGAEALSNNTRMSQNTAVGTYALQLQSYDAGTGQNTAVGVSALSHNQPTSASNGSQNTAVGAISLTANTTGFQNTALGTLAGSQYVQSTGYGGASITYAPITTGSNNTFLGWGTGATSASVVNCTAVGIDAYCDADNQVRLGNASVTSIGGAVAWSAVSDARAKSNIQDLSLGLDFVLGLRPVAYTLKRGNGRTDMGFLAQDVEALLGDGYNVVGVGGDPDRTRTLRYTDLIAPLVKAIQEQQAMLDARNARVEELERRLGALEERMAPRETGR